MGISVGAAVKTAIEINATTAVKIRAAIPVKTAVEMAAAG